MNTKKYGIRKKGDNEFLLTFSRDVERNDDGYLVSTTWLDEFCNGGNEEWFCDDAWTAINVLNGTSEFELGSTLNPQHELNKNDYEVVCIERKVTIVKSS